MTDKLQATTTFNSAYIIVSGLFRYDENALDKKILNEHFTHWKNRINKGEYQATYNYINSSYYDSYILNMFPDIRLGEKQNSKQLSHLTLKKPIEEPKLFQDFQLLIDDTTKINFSIEYADLFLFPHQIGIFSFKAVLNNEGADLGTISDFLNKIRHLHSTIISTNTNESHTLKTYTEKHFLPCIQLAPNWDIYNPQLKTYTIIDLKEKVDEQVLEELLYDLGNVAMLGTASGANTLSPSATYFQQQMTNNKISVFKNWSAISLFDTFTRISMDYPDTFKSWEYDYLHIYIYCLYIKFFMYLTNSELTDVTVVTKKTQHLRNKFTEFINDYSLSHISYKFMPNLLHDKLLYSLDIQSEIDRMETKIQRINEHVQEKSRTNLNKVLIIITFLSVFSLIFDLSEWFVNLGVSRQWMYPYSSIGIGVVILVAIVFVFKYNRYQ